MRPPGDAVIVQLPAGSPDKSTLPVGVIQDGCVIPPTIGALGAVGIAFKTAFNVAVEVQPELLVTVKLYVPEATNPVTVVVMPEPETLPLGEILTVQLPLAGNPDKSTLPVFDKQLGC